MLYGINMFQRESTPSSTEGPCTHIRHSEPAGNNGGGGGEGEERRYSIRPTKKSNFFGTKPPGQSLPNRIETLPGITQFFF
jgi:hypothetical protein